MDFDSDSVFERNKTGRDSEVRNLFRQGKVTERIVNNTGVTVRVQYLDKNGLVSKPLPVKQHGSRKTGSFYCPKIGDDVCVTMLPNGSEDGFVDGSFYNAGNPPPTTNPDCHHTTYEDGTIMEYDEVSHTLKVDSVGPVNITATGNVTVTSMGVATIKATSIVLDGPVHITKTLIVDGVVNFSAGGFANPKIANADGSGGGS